MRVAIAKRAIQDNQGEQLFHVLAHMRRVCKLPESPHDRGLVTAAIFLVGPAAVQYAEILKSAIGPVDAQVETVNDQCHAVLGQAVGGHVESVFARHGEAEVFVGRQLRVFVGLPQLHDVGRAFVALREAVSRMFHHGEGFCVAHQDFGLHAADPREGREFLQQIPEQVAAASAFENLVHRLEGHVLVQVFFVAGVADASDL